MTAFESLSARRAWIEIFALCRRGIRRYVALRKESVDRNNDTTRKKKINPVALRKESVDRNKCLGLLGWLRTVALRKESVDRNDVLAVSALLELSRSPQGERG